MLVYRGEEGLPRQALRIRDPRFLRLRVAARGLAFLEHRLVGLFQPSIDVLQLARRLDLDAKVVETGLSAAGRDREVQSGIVEHPLRVVRLGHRRIRREERAVEADRLVEISDRDVNVQALHGAVLLRLWVAGTHSPTPHAEASPWQQFSVR